jgi:hypothetical protein
MTLFNPRLNSNVMFAINSTFYLNFFNVMEAPGIRTKICTITIMFAINSRISFHFLDFELEISNQIFLLETINFMEKIY